MKNISKNCLKTSWLVLASIALPSMVLGDGYRNPPPTAEGIAKSGANSVFVDDASAISYNPANLGMMTSRSLVVSATLAQTKNTLSTTVPDFSSLPPRLVPATFESDDAWQILPNIFYAQPVGTEGLVVGLGVNTPYGQGISWDATDFQFAAVPSNTVPHEAGVKFINMNPTASAKILDGLYLGIGFDLVYSELNLKAVNGYVLPSPPFPSEIQQFANTEGKGYGWGFGGNAGLTWLPSDKHRLALTYRSRVDVNYEGNFYVDGSHAGDFETTIKYPNTFGLGYGIQIGDDIQVEALFEWLQWSVNESQTLNAGGVPLTVKNDWDDTFTLGVGGSWNVTDALVARAGYAYLPSPIPDSTATPLLPDADRHALSVGVGYSTGLHTLDLAYTFSIYGDRKTPKGSYEIDSNLVGVTYSLSF